MDGKRKKEKISKCLNTQGVATWPGEWLVLTTTVYLKAQQLGQNRK